MHKSLLALTAAAVLASAPTALAADREGKVSAASPVFNWDGGPGTSLGANAGPAGGVSVGNLVGCFEGIADCEDTLIKVETAGTLTVTTDVEGEEDTLDLYLYPSNAAGEFDNQATDMAEGGGAGTTGDEKIVAKVKPGFYMAHVKFFLAQDATYKGSAVLSGFAAPAPPAAAPTNAPPASAPSQPSQPSQPGQPSQPSSSPSSSDKGKAAKKKKACQKKAKKIKNAKKRKAALKKCSKAKK